MTYSRLQNTLMFLAVACMAATSHASITTSLTQQAGFGGAIDLTAGSYITWGYDSNQLSDGFTNHKSGTTVATVSSPTANNTRDYGYTFTFNDGDSPGSGTAVASSGGQAGLLDDGPTITFSGIISSTELRRLTLYVGGYHGSGANRGVDISFDATLTGGTSDETGITQVFEVNNDTSSAAGATTDGYAIATYTVEFISATESDLTIATSFANVSGTRNWGLSGYTVEIVPEPASLALTALGGLLLIGRRRDA